MKYYSYSVKDILTEYFGADPLAVMRKKSQTSLGPEHSKHLIPLSWQYADEQIMHLFLDHRFLIRTAIEDDYIAYIYQEGSTMLDSLSHRELVCGFLSGKDDIMNWEPSDLFQFCNDTTPIRGSLDEVAALVDESAVKRAVKIGACNIFHGCVHNMLHEKSEDVLRGLYKSAVFVVQAIVFQQTGSYIKNQKELLRVASADERGIVKTFLSLKNGGTVDFDVMSETLFECAKKWIAENS